MFGVHKESSLKVEARSKRGQRDTESFLRDSDNKTELFHFLADQLSEVDAPCLFIAIKEDVCCNRIIELEDLAACAHEEVDSRILCTYDMWQ